MVIYEPRGKALEYSPLAANLYKGCSHGCVYCYVPRIPPYKFKPREEFYTNPEPRKNIISSFGKSARKFAGNRSPVLFSFTSDPYQPIEKEYQITRQALEIVEKHNIQPQILTKGGSWPVIRDLDILKSCNAIWAATLTTDSDEESLDWEPGAALPKDRIESLKIAHKAGLETWVSFEPVINPEAVYRLIEKTHSFVDLYKVGKLNYHPLADEIDWKRFLLTAEGFLDKFNKSRYIKKDLENYRDKTQA